MSKIIRTPTRAEGGITPEEKQRFDDVAKFWIANAMRTDRADINKLAPAIHGMYEAAGLKKPRVVLVPSPLVMVAAYGASAAIWHRRKSKKHASTEVATDAATRVATRVATHDATYDATYYATYDATDFATDFATHSATRVATEVATRVATYDATYATTYDATDFATHSATRVATEVATHSATRVATEVATRVATCAATYVATYDATDFATDFATRAATYAATGTATDFATDFATRVATHSATRVATHDATYDATHDATYDATYDAMSACRAIAGDFGVECAKHWWRAYQCGNMSSGWCAYISGARDVLGLKLKEHDAYKHFEMAALNGGFRVMHDEFCIVSDFPEVLKVDENNLPHCENGPSHRWRDGWELYHWHGTRVPAHWIMNPSSVDPSEILSEQNVEVRAAGISIVGMTKMLDKLEHKIIDSDPDPMKGDLVEVRLPDLPDPVYYLSAHCPRNGRIMEAVNLSEMDEMTVKGAQAWRLGIPASEFVYPTIRT